VTRVSETADAGITHTHTHALSLSPSLIHRQAHTHTHTCTHTHTHTHRHAPQSEPHHAQSRAWVAQRSGGGVACEADSVGGEGDTNLWHTPPWQALPDTPAPPRPLAFSLPLAPSRLTTCLSSSQQGPTTGQTSHCDLCHPTHSPGPGLCSTLALVRRVAQICDTHHPVRQGSAGHACPT